MHVQRFGVSRKDQKYTATERVGGKRRRLTGEYGEPQDSFEAAVEQLVKYANAVNAAAAEVGHARVYNAPFLDKDELLRAFLENVGQGLGEGQETGASIPAPAQGLAAPAPAQAAAAAPQGRPRTPKRGAAPAAAAEANKRSTPPARAEELFDDSMPDSFEGSQSHSAGARRGLFASNPGGGRSGFNQGRGRAMGSGRGGGWLQRGNQPGFDFQDDGPGIARPRSRMQGGNLQHWVPAAGYPAGMAAAQHPARPPAQHYMQQGLEQPAPPIYDAYSYQQQQQQFGDRPPGAMQHLMQQQQQHLMQQQQQQQREGRLAGASAWGEGSGPRSAGWGNSEGYERHGGQPGSYEDGSGAMAGGRGGGQWGSPAPYVAERVDYSASQYEYDGAPPRGLAWPTGYRPNMPPANVVPTAAGQLASLQQRHNHEQLQQPNPNRQLVPAQVADRQLQMPAGVLDGGRYGLLPPPIASAPSPSALLVPSGGSAPPAAAAGGGDSGGPGLPAVLAAQGVPPQDANGLAQVLQGLPVVPGGMQVFNLFNINVNNHSTLNNLLQHGAPLGQGGAQAVSLDALDLQQRALLGGADMQEAAAAGPQAAAAAAAGPQAAAAAAAAGPQAAAAAAEALEGIELGAPRAQVLAAGSLAAASRHIYAQVPRRLLSAVREWAPSAMPRTPELTPKFINARLGSRVLADDLIDYHLQHGGDIMMLSFLGDINYQTGNTFLPLSIAPQPQGKLGRGGFGSVVTARLGAGYTGPCLDGLLPDSFVLKLSRFASVVPCSLPKVPRAFQLARTEYRGCSRVPDHPHILPAYSAGIVASRVSSAAGDELPMEVDSYTIDSCQGFNSTASSGTLDDAPGGSMALFAANVFPKLSGNCRTWLESNPYGAMPAEAALGTYQPLCGLSRLHQLGIVHK